MVALAPTVLVVDDDPALLAGLGRALRRAGYQTVLAETAQKARDLLDVMHVDAVVTDLSLPIGGGRVLAAELGADGRTAPVVVITGQHDLVAVHQMLGGTTPQAILPKPFVTSELCELVASSLRDVKAREPGCLELTRELARSMARALALRDVETEAHARRVAIWSRMLAERVGMDREAVFWTEIGALLHDVGKIGVPDGILKKPGPLDEAEWAIMRTHSALGARLLAPVRQLARARDVVLHHHESWDGSGYPARLAGEAIPLAARVFAPIDAYDAMTSDRPYRKGMPHDEAMARIAAGAGSQFDPAVVAALSAIDGTAWQAVRATVQAAEEAEHAEHGSPGGTVVATSRDAGDHHA